MGRSPCCDKVGLKKGPWTPEEDEKLLAFVQQHGHGSWRALPSKAGLQRCGKSCRLRWINYLRPDIKRGKFSVHEEQTIIQLHALLGNRWSAIATHLSKRTDNEIKNYWNTHLKKRLVKMGIDPVSHKPKNETLLFSDGHLKRTANLSHMAQWESARLEAESRLVKQSKFLPMNSLSNQVNSAMRSLTSTSKTPPRCIDLHKTGNGVLSNTLSDGSNVNVNGDTESPTSTLMTTKLGDSSTGLFELVVGVDDSFRSCNDEPIIEEHAKECEYKDHWNETENTILMVNDEIMPAMDSAWTIESVKSSSNNDELVPSDNFLESFTDLLLCGSDCSDHNSSQNDDYRSDIALICSNSNNSSIESTKNCHEDKNKNYWDNILSSMNSSSSNSLMF